MIKLLFFSLVFCVMPVLSMQEAEAPMISIGKWDDIKQLAGQIVIYQASLCLADKSSYGVTEDPSLRVGYIPSQVHFFGMERGYRLYPLVPSDAQDFTCSLYNDTIKKNGEKSIHMRKPSQQECKAIDKACKSKKARFVDECFFEKRIQEILGR